MPLAACPRCNKTFDKQGTPVCPACQETEEGDYEKIREALQDNPNMSAEEVAEEAEVDLECVLRLLDQGRIKTVQANLDVKCGRCGAPAISISKKLCESCLNKLNAEVAMQQAKIKLNAKKKVDIGTAMNVPDAVSSRRGSDGRKNLLRRDGSSQ